MILNAEEGLNCHLFDFEFSDCDWSTPPDGWQQYVVSPDCAAARTAVMYPTDGDDEVIVFGEAIKRNISSLGLTAGTTVVVSLTAGVGNYLVYVTGGYLSTFIPEGDHTFNVRAFVSEPSYTPFNGAACTSGGQLLLSGTNGTLNGIVFTDTVTLTQDANWIAVGNCHSAIPSGGSNVFDDLKICW